MTRSNACQSAGTVSVNRPAGSRKAEKQFIEDETTHNYGTADPAPIEIECRLPTDANTSAPQPPTGGAIPFPWSSRPHPTRQTNRSTGGVALLRRALQQPSVGIRAEGEGRCWIPHDQRSSALPINGQRPRSTEPPRIEDLSPSPSPSPLSRMPTIYARGRRGHTKTRGTRPRGESVRVFRAVSVRGSTPTISKSLRSRTRLRRTAARRRA